MSKIQQNQQNTISNQYEFLTIGSMRMITPDSHTVKTSLTK
jgi:hypothetical protein